MIQVDSLLEQIKDKKDYKQARIRTIQQVVTGQDAPNENHAGDQNAAVTHPANQKNQVGAGTWR